jgi:hypothetical protein
MRGLFCIARFGDAPFPDGFAAKVDDLELGIKDLLE